VLDHWLALYHAVTAHNGAEPDASRRLLSWLRAAGFARVRVRTTTVEFAEAEEVQAWGEAWAAPRHRVQPRDAGNGIRFRHP
jgi:hypothetical protein